MIYHIQENRHWENLPHRLFSKWADANKLLSYLSDEAETPGYLGTNWTGKTLQKYKDSIHWVVSRLQKYKSGMLQLHSGNDDEEKDDVRFIEHLVRYPDLEHMNQERPNTCHLSMYQGYFEKSE